MDGFGSASVSSTRALTMSHNALASFDHSSPRLRVSARTNSALRLRNVPLHHPRIRSGTSGCKSSLSRSDGEVAGAERRLTEGQGRAGGGCTAMPLHHPAGGPPPHPAAPDREDLLLRASASLREPIWRCALRDVPLRHQLPAAHRQPSPNSSSTISKAISSTIAISRWKARLSCTMPSSASPTSPSAAYLRSSAASRSSSSYSASSLA